MSIYFDFKYDVHNFLKDAEVRSPLPSKNTKSKTKLWPSVEGDNQHRFDLLSGSWTDLNTFKSRKGGTGRLSSFQPKHFTFNFMQRPRKHSNQKATPLRNRIASSSILEFTDFVDLFKSFIIHTKKDIFDLFKQLLHQQSRTKQSEHFNRISGWRKPSGNYSCICVLQGFLLEF